LFVNYSITFTLQERALNYKFTYTLVAYDSSGNQIATQTLTLIEPTNNPSDPGVLRDLSNFEAEWRQTLDPDAILTINVAGPPTVVPVN
jgi:hypothetical protein